MKNKIEEKTDISASETQVSRRKFFGKLGTAAVGAAALGAATPFLGGKESVAEAAGGNSESPGRMNDCFNYRKNMAIAQRVNVGVQPDNGDEARFTDFSGKNHRKSGSE